MLRRSCWSRSPDCPTASKPTCSGSSRSARLTVRGTVRIAQDEAERALLWKGRKNAFGAIARIKPNYYLHDTVVPRRRLPDVLKQVYEIVERHNLLVMNVFHAGDGNLHPLLVFDKREPGVMDRVHAAGEEIVRVSVAAGGVLSGEHGIGLEKRDFMPLMFSAGRSRRTGPPASFVRHHRPGQPQQGASIAGLVRRPAARAGGRVDLTAFAADVGSSGPVTITGLGTRGGPVPGVRTVRPPAGIEWIQADEMTMRCGAGTAVADVDAALAEVGQCVALPPDGTVGGALSVGQQRHPPAGLRPRPRRAAAGLLRVRRRRGRAGRWADGEERQRLRPVPTAGRCQGHARVPRRRHLAHPASCRRIRSGSRSRPTTRSRSSPVSTARSRCCGTARGCGRCSRAIPTTSPRKRPDARWLPVTARQRCRQGAGVSSPRPTITSLTGEFVAEIGVGVVHHADPLRATSGISSHR